MLYVFTCLTLGSQSRLRMRAAPPFPSSGMGAHACSRAVYVVCVGQLATVLGPTLALNGPRGSLEKAVTEMRTERGRVFKVFVFGIATFFMEIMAVTAINVEDSWLAAVCIAIIAVALVLIGYYGRRLIRVFHFEETELQQLVRIDRLKDVVMPDDKETKAEDVKITTTSAAEFLGVSDDKAGKFERDKEGDS